EMVRQLFQSAVLQSAFWHQFTMTAHSPVGLDPEKYKLKKASTETGTFANNDIIHIDPTGANHDTFGFGLKKSLLNFMHGACLDYPLQKWFDFKVPKTLVPPDYIAKALLEEDLQPVKPTTKVIWLGKQPLVENFTKSKKGDHWEMSSLTFQSRKETNGIKVNKAQGQWLTMILQQLSVDNLKIYTLKEVKESYEASGLVDFELFWDNKPINTLYKIGLLQL
ncbi:MAG: radical SAM protein, partial [Ferruginibacter sp.]